MTATVPSRLDRVAEYARQLGRRPSSNEVRALLRVGRDTANTLLRELDQVARPGPELAAAEPEPRPDTGGDQQQSTMLVPAPERPGVAPDSPERDRNAAVLTHFGPVAGAVAQVDSVADSAPPVHRGWLALLALPAFVAVWGGWVGLGGLAGFGPVRLLPGIADHFTVNLAVTLPAGMEVYAVIGLRVWLSSRTRTDRTRRFAA